MLSFLFNEKGMFSKKVKKKKKNTISGISQRGDPSDSESLGLSERRGRLIVFARVPPVLREPPTSLGLQTHNRPITPGDDSQLRRLISLNRRMTTAAVEARCGGRGGGGVLGCPCGL